MNKVIKLVSVLLMVVMMTSMVSTVCFAGTEVNPDSITPDYTGDTGKITAIGQKILGIIRNIAAVLLVVLIAVLGLKYMMGSTEEKAEYKKTAIPLIVGTVVVLLATSIGGFIWSTFSSGV